MSKKTTKGRQRRTPESIRRSARGGPAREKTTPSEQFQRLVFEHNLIGMYRTTLEGRILDCNESMARMLKYASRDELLHHPATELYHSSEDRQEFLNRLRAAGTLINSELCLRCKDGSSIHILENVSLVPGDHAGPPTIQGTMVDITQRKLAEQALRESEARYRLLAEELRRLARHVQQVREAERTRIARELHDELGQALTVLNMELHWLQGRSRPEFEAAQDRVRSMCELVSDTIRALRRICADLRPAVLDDLGLIAAIEWQVREFQTRTGIRCLASLPDAPLDLPKDQATAVFRILQESLTNIARHARATEAKVSLRLHAKDLVLQVGDNGVGISREQSKAPRSLGLVGMRERALQWNGRVQVDRLRRDGTLVVLHMPIARPSEEAAS